MAVLLAPLAFQTAVADDGVDTSRAATRQNSTTITAPSRKKASDTTPGASLSQPASRAINTGVPTATRSRSTATNTISRPASTNANTERSAITVTTRTPTIKILPRTIKTGTQTSSRTRSAHLSTAATSSRTAKNTGRSATVARTGTTGVHRPSATSSRNAIAANTVTASDMLTRDFSKCRTVFYDCMDEFCANKDTQLKRCACSTRINEFNSTKKNLTQVEDKLLDFSQRLLTVNMDKEDAAALNQATEGELAFAAADTSKSKQMLDEIAKKLNTSFNDSNFDQNLNAISLSLNMDAAFDTVDSLAGASTTAKSGTDLYVAALPVCRQMAAEVCTPDDLKIAESGYQVAIEQDCNTVKKSYQTQVDQARTKVFESGALLDMARLDIHQKRNSDDILTCKKKMLDMLTDTTVCGDNLGNCLDTTGRYIDPSTGEAFLTNNLAELGDLIKRPGPDHTWSTEPGNERFVAYLNTKKKYLEPAMENCQDISDYVWESFLDDALAQIKLAQEDKLEQVRQSCTTLTTQCLDKAADSLADFDARALSIFGIAADKTVNAMCEQVRSSCSALLNSTGGGEDWTTGMTQISTEKTYESILQTCREIGRACIIQACTSTSGNFGLCENIDTSINRKSIINRTACWDEVYDCVASAGPDALDRIQAQHPLSLIKIPSNQTSEGDSTPFNYNFYTDLYNITTETKDNTVSSDYILSPSNDKEQKACIGEVDGQKPSCVYDICNSKCSYSNPSTEYLLPNKCYACRMAERIWGNCEAVPTAPLENATSHNKIKVPTINGVSDVNGTLLSWFAQNTGTANAADNCRDTSCGPGYKMTNGGYCYDANNMSGFGDPCVHMFEVTEGIPNCCDGETYDNWGNCCQDKNSGKYTDTPYYTNTKAPALQDKNICTPANATPVNLIAYYTDSTDDIDTAIICLGEIDTQQTGTQSTAFPSGDTITCKGDIIAISITDSMSDQTPAEIIADKAYYYDPITDTNKTSEAVTSYFKDKDYVYTYDHTTNIWSSCKTDTNNTNPNKWSVKYTTQKAVCDSASKAPAKRPTTDTTDTTTQ